MPVALNLPTPGQSPNWANQLNTEIEKINQSTNQGVYFASDYGVIGDGSADDTNTMQNLIDLVPEGSKIVSPPGASYRTEGWVVEGKSIALDFSNATLWQLGEDPIISATGAWDPPQSVAAVVNGVGSSRVTVADSSQFSVNDVVKVVSDDLVAEARDPGDGSRARQGEFATVISIDGSDLVVSPGFYDEYSGSNNIRVFRMIDSRVSVKFGDVNFSGSGASSFGGAAFWFSSLISPQVSGHFSRARTTAVTFEGCFQARASITLDYAPASYGYVINSRGSVGGDYHLGALRCRHLFTDNITMTDPGGEYDPHSYGRSMYESVTGLSYGNGGSSSVDTHHGGVGHSFYNIKVVGHPGQVAFQMRGIGHTMYNCEAHGGDVGFLSVDEAFWGNYDYVPSTAIRLVNCLTRNVGTPFRVDKSQSDSVQDYPEPTLTVEGGTFEYHGDHPQFISSHVVLDNPSLVYTSQVLSNPMLTLVGGGSLIGSVRIRAWSANSGSQPSVIRVGNSAAARTLDLDVSLWANPYVRENTQYFASLTSGTIGQVRGNLVSGSSSSMIPVDLTEGLSAADVSVILKSPRLQSVNERYQGVTAWAGKELSEGGDIVFLSGDPVVTLELRASGGITAGTVYPAAQPGQLLVLRVSDYSSGAVAIPHGATFNTDIGGDINLQPGRALTLVWSGTAGLWYQVP